MQTRIRKVYEGVFSRLPLRNTPLRFIGLLAFALTFTLALPAMAGSLSVSPLRLTFSGGSGIAALTIENRGPEEALVQAETFAWSQVDGEHKLIATDDVVAVPPVFKLAPGAQQRVRVGLTRAITESKEQTYRVTITEVPTNASPGTIAVAVRHSMPIFVLPTSPVSPNLAVKIAGSGNLEIANNGTQHLRILRWRLRDSAGAVVAEDSGPGYLLAGANQFLTVTAKNIARHAVLEAESDVRTLKITVSD